MKKWALLFSIAFALLLAGCGQEAGTDSSENAGEENAAKEEEKLTAEDVYKKATEKSQDMKNFELDGSMDMKMTFGEETQEMNMKINSKSQLDPLLIHQTMESDAQSAEMEIPKMEMYMTDEYMYMKDAQSGQWLKMKQAQQGFMKDMMEQQKSMSPVQNLEMLKQFADEMTLEETDDTYVLKITGNGDKLVDLVKEMNPGGASGVDFEQMMQQMNFEEIKYSYALNKETFQPESFEMDMTMSVTQNDQTMKINQHMTSNIKNINEVEDLSIPEEVKNNAQEIEVPQQPAQPGQSQQQPAQPQEQPAEPEVETAQ
ncbi:hypothetical protein LC040_02430 [Bacillus tianshenii]|nr:hypothetical protein LC040_02430 [Bacillus tianshenii]